MSASDTSTGSGTRPDDDLPAAFPALWRTFRLGMRAEPRLLLLSLGLALLMMLPDALLALWLSLLVSGIGSLLGYLGTGLWFRGASHGLTQSPWPTFWTGLSLAVGGVLAYFLVAYKGREAAPVTPSGAAIP